ncbi:PKD domain-containing protein [Saccharicrinis sp. FJH54]|uniref:PKD domain-containing protein n=1 Tax=Saccharicrinis sp. FJH54 TaxID=3344665 RepID=UPI0035D42D4E
MKLVRFIFGFTIVLILISCGKEPIADFTWEPKEPKAGEEVRFTNLSTDATSYSWNFGDMSIGDDTNPTHIYERKGNYIIDLRAQNGLRSDEKTVTITVTD